MLAALNILFMETQVSNEKQVFSYCLCKVFFQHHIYMVPLAATFPLLEKLHLRQVAQQCRYCKAYNDRGKVYAISPSFDQLQSEKQERQYHSPAIFNCQPKQEQLQKEDILTLALSQFFPLQFPDCQNKYTRVFLKGH